MTTTPGLGPILTAHLFRELDARLVELLESLDAAEWRRPTVAGAWCVHEVAAHLLDTALRRLSSARDGYVPELPAAAPVALVDLIDRLNARGVEVYGRLSPPVLIALTRATLPPLHAYLESLDPFAPAAFAVSWAGEEASANWFDVARELTERWHHQQQIRLALDRPGLLSPRLYGPVLECFVRVLPHAYAAVEAPAGAVLRLTVTGPCGASWHLERRRESWAFVPPAAADRLVAAATMPEALAWRVFTRAVAPAEARAASTVEGDARIGAAVFDALAIVAHPR